MVGKIKRTKSSSGGSRTSREGRKGSGGKQMEGGNLQRRGVARKARAHGKKPSEVGGTLGASKQRVEASPEMSHQQKLDLSREGKQTVIEQRISRAKPGSRDGSSLDRERFPRLDP